MRWRGVRQRDGKIERDEAQRNVQGELVRHIYGETGRWTDRQGYKETDRQTHEWIVV
jgi:hypothetical protein